MGDILQKLWIDKIRLLRLTVRTAAFQAVNRGSIPLGATSRESREHRGIFAWLSGSFAIRVVLVAAVWAAKPSVLPTGCPRSRRRAAEQRHRLTESARRKVRIPECHRHRRVAEEVLDGLKRGTPTCKVARVRVAKAVPTDGGDSCDCACAAQPPHRGVIAHGKTTKKEDAPGAYGELLERIERIRWERDVTNPIGLRRVHDTTHFCASDADGPAGEVHGARGREPGVLDGRGHLRTHRSSALVGLAQGRQRPAQTHNVPRANFRPGLLRAARR